MDTRGSRIIRWTLVGWCAAAGVAAVAQVAVPPPAPPVWKASLQPNGAVRLVCDGEDFGVIAPALFVPEWRYVELSSEPAERDGRGFPAPELVGPEGETVAVRMRVSALEGGALRFEYELRPRAPAILQGLNAELVMPFAVVSGGRWKAEDEFEGEIPEEMPQQIQLYSGTLRRAELTDAHGRRLQFNFDEPTPVLFQDNRRWTPTFILRAGYAGNPREFTPETSEVIAFTVTADTPIAFEPPAANAAAASATPDDWTPLTVELDIAPDSALDLSGAPWRDAPAGRWGRLIARPDGRFAFERAPKVPRRFYGVNLCFSASFPDRDQADRLAERFARLGYNAVRWHHHDRDLADPKDPTRPDPRALERLHYFFAALKQRGIYVSTDLYVSRAIPAAAVWPEAAGPLTMEEYKLLLPVNARAEAELREFTRRWLGAKNPHTGASLAEDPALAWVSLVNENNPSNYWNRLTPRVAAEWRVAWNRWLAARYPQTPDLFRAWGEQANHGALFRDDPLPNSLDSDTPRGRDFMHFLADTQRAFYERTARFLREELRCRALLSDLNGWTQRRAWQWTRSAFDYVDDHFYVDHPHFLRQPWQLPSRLADEHPAAPGGMGGLDAAFTRLLGKPMVISEYNYAAPGRHRGAGGLLAGALASLQDWGAIFRFAYSHSLEGMFEPRPLGYFDLAADPLNLAADRIGLLIFLREDLAPAPLTIALQGVPGDFVGPDALNTNLAPQWGMLALVARVGYRMELPAATDPAEWRVPLRTERGASPLSAAETGRRLLAELRAGGRLGENNPTDLSDRIESVGGALQVRVNERLIRLDTPRTAGVVGPAGARAAAGALEAEILDTPATAVVTSLDGRPLRESGRVLVCHLTDVRNTDQQYDPRRRVLSDWGRLPLLARNGRARLRLARAAPPGAVRAWALSTGGRRIAEAPVRVEPDGAVALECSVAGPEGARLLYEIVIE